jgi:hypothetical protein
MAVAVKGANKTKYDAGTLIENGEGQAQMLVSSDSYLATNLADAATISVCNPLPAGAKIQLIVIKHPAFATGRTLSIGTAASATAFAATQSIAAAGTLVIPCGNYVVGTTANDDQMVVLTAGTCNSATALQYSVFYTL